MVKLTRIYTGGGDRGETSLAGGKRVVKSGRRIAAIGAVDEANAAVGVARLYCDGGEDDILGRIQNDLFDLGADLATPRNDDAHQAVLKITASQVIRLEGEIDAINKNLQPLNSFILPGGSRAAAQLHLARTVARRAETKIAALGETETVNEEALRYANRLSDLLFVLARRMNGVGKDDVLWRPGANG
ncbi:MAG TPA: cob(I)yrinic acid a,c-diamide adenosyltransferase [Alphaproteobacteria bacterium]|nr:cob(I)yrinic acid a,c-diamide adenosyltransferase [Alphaproteobacteria bacterium]